MPTRFGIIVVVLAVVLGCGESTGRETTLQVEAAPPSSSAMDPQEAAAPPREPLHPSYQEKLAFLETLRLDEMWKGDLDGIIERRRLRILTTYSRVNYFLDGGRPRGITYEAVEELVAGLNKELRLGRRPIRTVYIPARRDRIFDELLAGRGDLAAATLTITEAREEQVDFTIPVNRGFREVVVTGPGAPQIESLDDLSGVEVWVRPSSSFYESLVRLNRGLQAEGRPPIVIVPAPELLETEEILEIINAGTMSVTLVDEDVAGFWADVLPNLVVRDDLVTRNDVKLAWAVHPDRPQLLARLNEFLKTHGQGTLFGNILMRRYLKDNVWVKNARAKRSRERLTGMVEIFQKYAKQYELEWLLVAAQAYQESGLDQSKVSSAGAVGVMQLLPSTAASHEVRIPDIENLESNIHAGVKYLRVLHDNYFNDPGMTDLNRSLFSFAGYNAGPNRIQRLRKVAEQRGLDPNEWFENVEVVVAEKVGSEPVKYVSNIYKYYVAYTLELGYSRRTQEILGEVRGDS
jgi:membrane-bound lytic murein transglycosylase MltF